MNDDAVIQCRERQRAVTIAIHAVGWPTLVAFALLVAYEFRDFARDTPIFVALLGVYCGTAMIVGTAIGWAAHQIFGRSSISMALILSLLLDFTVFGWVVVHAHGFKF